MSLYRLWQAFLRKATHTYRKSSLQSRLAFRGYEENLAPGRFLDTLSDSDLRKLNELLDWHCFTADSRGRRFGNAAWDGKRSTPQTVPDRRILLMHEWFDLSDKHVLEVGCFEGIHTVGLSQLSRRVTAIDSRIENVVKSIVRCAFYGYTPTVFKCDLEQHPLNIDALSADLLHHVGVLYHLSDPVRHLLEVGRYIRRGLMLDTHYATEDQASERYEVNGHTYRFFRYFEGGREDVFSGMHDHAKWLRLDDIVDLVRRSGFSKVEVLEARQERNGPRVLLVGAKEQPQTNGSGERA